MKSFIALAASLLVLAGCATTSTTSSSPSGSAARPAPSAPPPAAPSGPNVNGAWSLTVESPQGSNTSVATFQQSGSALSGNIAGQAGQTALTGSIQGSNIAFSISINVQGTPLKLDYTGKVEGDSMSGTVKFGDFGEGPWTAKKKS